MNKSRDRIAVGVLWATLLLAISLWLGDAIFKYLWANTEESTFITHLVARNDPHELLLRMVFTGVVLIGGLSISRVLARLAVSEEDARRREEDLRTTLNSIGDAVIATDAGGFITRMNPVAAELTGWITEEATGRALTEVFKIFNSQTGQPVSNPVQKVFDNGEIVGLANHTMLISRDGSEYQIADSAAPIRTGDGQITGAVLVFRDVTDEYRMQAALRENERFLEAIFDAIQDGISVLDLDFNIVRANGWMQSKYADQGSLEGRKCFAAYQHRDSECSWCPVVKTRETGKTHWAEVPYPDEQNIEGWIDLSAFPLKNEQGEVTGVIEYVKDITERKRAEEMLHRFEHIVSSSNDMLALLDRNFVYLAVNEAYCRAFGRTHEELIGQTAAESFGREFFDTVIKPRAERCLAGENIRFQDWFEYPVGGLKYMDVAYSPYVDPQNQTQGFVVTARDISQIKQAEESLREERERAETYLDLAGVMFVAINLRGEVTLVNRKACEVLGYSAQEIVGRNWFDSFLPRHMRETTKEVSEQLLRGEIEPAEYYENPILTSSGQERLIAWHNTILRDSDGAIAGHLSSGEDITDRRQVEENLQGSEERYRTLVANIPGVSYRCLYDERRTVEFISNEVEALTGYPASEFIQNRGRTLASIMHPEDARMVGDAVARAVESKEPYTLEYRLFDRDGGIHWVFEKGQGVVDVAGQVRCLDGVFVDITERKEAEHELAATTAFLNTTVDMSPFAMWIADPDGTIIRTNSSLRKILQLTDEQIVGKYNVLADENLDAQDLMPLVKSVFREHRPARFTMPWKAAYAGDVDFSEARDLHIDVSMFPILSGDGDLAHVVCQWVDITERVEAEEALRASEERLRRAVQTMPVMVDAFDDNQNIIVWNRECERVTGYTGAEVIGNPDALEMLYPDPDYRRHVLDTIEKANGDFRNLDFTLVSKNGEQRTVVWSNLSDSHPIAGWTTWAVGIDITERKQMEEAIQAQMETQKLLLSELDHRVRNNLSSLLSLIDLSRTGAGSIDDLASTMRSRTQAIASVHSILSGGNWLGGDLKTMVKTLVQPPRNTQINAEGPTSMIPLSQAQALGLVINELATNSTKYGAMSVDDGSINITWSRQESGSGQVDITLCWSESGGPPILGDPKPGTGTNLIVGLSRSELRGRADLTYPPEGALHTLHMTLAPDATAQFTATALSSDA